MILDHIKYAIPETQGFVTQYFGRISFPLFAFLLTEGFCHTSNLKKYYKRLMIFAIISQIPFMLFRTLVGEWRMFNILFTLLLGLTAIVILDRFERKYYISLPLVSVFLILGKYLRVDYGWYGVACVVVLYIGKDRKFGRIIAFAILNLIYYYQRLFVIGSKENIISYVFTTIPVFLLLFYNGKLGTKTKYLYYLFYPIHMIVLYGIHFI